MIEVGTRTKANQLHTRAPQGTMTRGFTRDLGLLKQSAGASATFATNGTITSSNGNFPGFAVNDVILTEGTSLNNGYATVTAIDGVNQAFIVIDPPPKAETSPPNYTIRTA